ncbi:hypothetical protein AAMO2058_000609100 [Amorphochlora amoebiformis]
MTDKKKRGRARNFFRQILDIQGRRKDYEEEFSKSDVGRHKARVLAGDFMLDKRGERRVRRDPEPAVRHSRTKPKSSESSSRRRVFRSAGLFGRERPMVVEKAIRRATESGVTEKIRKKRVRQGLYVPPGRRKQARSNSSFGTDETKCPDNEGTKKSECPDNEGTKKSECPDNEGTKKSECPDNEGDRQIT